MTGYGSRYDIRVATYYGEDLVTFWQQSFDFEPWTDPNDAKADSL